MPKVENVRKVDNFGRITIPSKFRRMLNISLTDPLAIRIKNDTIILRKPEEEEEEFAE